MPNGATIVAGALSGFHHSLRAHGIDGRRLGRDHGIPVAVWTDRNAEIPLRTFVKLYEAGSAESGLCDLGWSTGSIFDLRVLGSFGKTVLSAPTVGAALRIFEQFLQLVQSDTELRLSVDGSRAHFSYRILNPDIWPRRQDAEFTLSTVTNLIQRSAGYEWRPDDLAFEHEPVRREQEWNETAGTDCRFGEAANSFSFPAAILDLPMPDADSDGYRDLRVKLNDDVAQRNRTARVSRRVASLIYSRLGVNSVDADSVARSLGLSRRTLHRRLTSENTGFSNILDDCRCRLAQRYLSDPRRSLCDIAFALSYSDQSAFGRAFRRHTGMTPQEYRIYAASAGSSLQGLAN